MIMKPRDLAKMISDLKIQATIVKSKHFKILLEGPKGRAMVVASSSPSTSRNHLHLRAELRRRAREVGQLAVA